MNVKRARLRKKLEYRSVDVAQWIVYSIIVGILAGGTGCLFGMAIEKATDLRMDNDWLVWLMPVAGLMIVEIYKVCHIDKVMGTNRVLLAVHQESGIALRMMPLIFSASFLTHLTGGSSGREGAALQIGGSIGNFIGRKIRMSHVDLRTMTMCGMSAGFSGLFGTPLAAALFSMEVAGGELHYAALFPCLMSSTVARLTAMAMGGHAEKFHITGMPEFTAEAALASIILGAMLAFVAMLFCVAMHKAPELYAKYFKNPYIRIAVAGAFIAAVTTIMGTRDYNGAGGYVIERAVEGEAVPYAFLLKILFTALTLGAGFKGGEIVPSFYIGATFGCTAAPFLGLDPGFAAALGMAGMFCGVTNCPISSILLAYEMFGGQSLILFALCCSMSYLLSGHYSLYSAQKLVHDKFHLE